MKNSTLNFKAFALMAVISFSIITSCKKRGETGPQGETGLVGANGTDGSTMLSGTGIPDPALGKTGDYYLDKSDAGLYGPKNASGWGAALILKGATGAIGATGVKGDTGAQVLAGAGAPVNTVGANGDFYFDKQNLAIYGPKVSGNWGTATSLKDPDNGVVTLVWRNRAFVTVDKDTQQEAWWNAQIASYNNNIATYTASISNYLSQYNQIVTSINGNSSYSAQQKQDLTANALATFNNNTATLNTDIQNAQQQIAYYQKLIELGAYDMSSTMKIDAKYKAAYDDGLVIVTTRPTTGTFGWSPSHEIQLAGVTGFVNPINPEYWFGNEVDNKTNNDDVIIEGSSYALAKASVDALRFDVKVVLISPFQVQTMANKGVNTKNLGEVVRFLNVQ